MILDYSNYVEDRKSSTPHGDVEAKDLNFFRKGWCPFCRAPAMQVADEKEEEHISPIDEYGIFRSAWQCPCGWWQTHYYDWRHDSGLYWDHYGVRHAILRSYDPSDSALPIATLRRALVKNPELIDAVGRKKTEDLVASIFGDYFDCEVRLVGKSHDGGIDLVLIIADKNALVQVKHRDKGSERWRAEPVSTVREFLGAVVLATGQHGILVTTAHHFSREATSAADRAITLGLVHQYDLLARGELFEVLNLTSCQVHEHWRHNLIFTAT